MPILSARFGYQLPSPTISNTLGVVTSASATLTFLDPSAPPLIVVNESSFGFRTNQFGFNLSGVIGQNVVIEGSTNFSIWEALATNTLSSGPLYFADPAATNFLRRFYRGRLK